MSVVWRGVDDVLGRSVAIKLLSGQRDDRLLRKRFRVEARTAAQLSHPHICQVFDYGESLDESGEYVPYIVMELLSGPTMARQLRSGPLPVRTALRVCAQVASALAAAHSRGMVHRDVKPGNIIITATGPKVLDFGIAAVAGQPSDLTPAGELWGTPAYVAPERLTGGEVMPASDVYGLGLLLYRALTGKAPWRAETITEMLDAHQYREPAPLPPVDGLPPAAANLCHGCLAKDPLQRPTAHDVTRLLAEAGGWRVSSSAEGILVDLEGQPEGPPAQHPHDRAQAALSMIAGAQQYREVTGSASADPPEAPLSPTETGTKGPEPRRPGTWRRHRKLVLAAVSIVTVAAMGGLWVVADRIESDLGFDIAGPGTGAEESSGPSGDGSRSAEPGLAEVPNRPGAGAPQDASGAGGGESDAPVPPWQTAPGAAGSDPSGSGPPGPAPSGSAGPDPFDSGDTDDSGSSGDSGDGNASELTERAFETPAGTLVARCIRSSASLAPASVRPEYRVVDETTGPGPRAGMVLRSDESSVVVALRCQGGEPIITVEVT